MSWYTSLNIRQCLDRQALENLVVADSLSISSYVPLSEVINPTAELISTEWRSALQHRNTSGQGLYLALCCWGAACFKIHVFALTVSKWVVLNVFSTLMGVCMVLSLKCFISFIFTVPTHSCVISIPRQMKFSYLTLNTQILSWLPAQYLLWDYRCILCSSIFITGGFFSLQELGLPHYWRFLFL